MWRLHESAAVSRPASGLLQQSGLHPRCPSSSMARLGSRGDNRHLLRRHSVCMYVAVFCQCHCRVRHRMPPALQHPPCSFPWCLTVAPSWSRLLRGSWLTCSTLRAGVKPWMQHQPTRVRAARFSEPPTHSIPHNPVPIAVQAHKHVWHGRRMKLGLCILSRQETHKISCCTWQVLSQRALPSVPVVTRPPTLGLAVQSGAACSLVLRALVWCMCSTSATLPGRCSRVSPGHHSQTQLMRALASLRQRG